MRAGGIVPGRDVAGAIDATLTATRDVLRVQTLAMALGPTRLHAAGSYAWSGHADITFEVQADDLSALARTFELSELSEPPVRRARSDDRPGTASTNANAPISDSGIVAGSARLAGRAWGAVASPQVDATLDARDLSVDGVDVGATNATFALAGNRLHVQASAPALAIVAQADVDTLEPYHYQAETRLEGARIAALVPPRVRERVAVSEGIVAGTLRARGTLRQPLPAAADVSLDQLDAVVNGTRVVLEAPAAIAWTPSRFAVREPRTAHRTEWARAARGIAGRRAGRRSAANDGREPAVRAGCTRRSASPGRR